MFTEQASHNQGRTVLPKINQDALTRLPVPVAPANEQRRIVAKLEALQARSRRARQALDAVPLLLEKLRQSILAAAFRGDLTKDWRAKHKNVEPASELLKRIHAERRKKWEESELAKMRAKGKVPPDGKWKAKYKEPAPVDTMGLPELPEGWCWISIETAGDVLLGRRRAAEEYIAGKDGRVMRPYVRVANVKKDLLDLSDVLEMPFNDVELSLYRLAPGDIILSEGQSPELVGQSAVFAGGRDDLCIQATVHRFRAYKSATSSAFAQLVFLSHLHTGVFMRASSLTTNIAHLTSERLKPLRFPLPPLPEQTEMVVHVRAMLESIKRLEACRENISTRERFMSAAILAKAFRGELVGQELENGSFNSMHLADEGRISQPILVEEMRRLPGRTSP
jgi:type I restriction enzyme S subunit